MNVYDIQKEELSKYAEDIIRTTAFQNIPENNKEIYLTIDKNNYIIIFTPINIDKLTFPFIRMTNKEYFIYPRRYSLTNKNIPIWGSYGNHFEFSVFNSSGILKKYFEDTSSLDYYINKFNISLEVIEDIKKIEKFINLEKYGSGEMALDSDEENWDKVILYFAKHKSIYVERNKILRIEDGVFIYNFNYYYIDKEQWRKMN